MFYYTVSDLNLILQGHEIDKRDEWERMRIGAYITVSPHMKKGSKIKPETLIPLPWDKKTDSISFIERAKILTEKLKARDNVKTGN